MGTTLTGTTPQDTYDSLIKVTNNGPLSSTARYLSDGLGNDSALALSTAQVGVGTTTLGTNYPLTIRSAAADYTKMLDWGTAVGGSWGSMTINTTSPYETILTSGEWAFKTGITERMRITSAGNVGIGTSSPDGKLDVASAGNLVSTGAFTNPHLALTASASLTDNDSFVGITYATSDAANYGWSMGAKRETGGNGFLEIRQHFNSATGTQIARFTGNGLCFGSDVAAANALDDYEEGTFTVTLTPSTSGTISLNASYNTWTYTKIGRQVVARGVAIVSSVSSPVGGVVYVSLPFTNQNVLGAYGSVNVDYYNTAASPVFQTKSCYIAPNQAQCILQVDASTVASGHEIYVTATYFV